MDMCSLTVASRCTPRPKLFLRSHKPAVAVFMSSIVQTQQAVSGITRRIIAQQLRRQLARLDPVVTIVDANVTKDAMQLYRSFLLDPRGAFRETSTPRVSAIGKFQQCLLQCPATPEAPAEPELKAAAELVGLLLSIARANGITRETIQEARQAERFDLDDEYNHYNLVPDDEPEPAIEQQSSYSSTLCKFTAATEEGGSLHGLRDHPSVQFIMAWLNYKVGFQANLLSAMKLFTTAAANPVLRVSCILLRGLCLFHLAQDTAAQQELEAGLQQQAESKAALKAEDSLVVAAHSALALIWNIKAPSAEMAAPAATEAAGPAEKDTARVLTPGLCKALEHYKSANDIALRHAQNSDPLYSSNSPLVRLLSKARAALSEHLSDDPLVKALNQLRSPAGASASWMAHHATELFSGVSTLQPLYEYDSMAVIPHAGNRFLLWKQPGV